MSAYRRIGPTKRGSTRPLRGLVTNESDGTPVNLDGAQVEFVARRSGETTVRIRKRNVAAGGSDDELTTGGTDRNEWTVYFDVADTTWVDDEGEILLWELQVIEQDGDSDTPVYGDWPVEPDLITTS